MDPQVRKEARPTFQSGVLVARSAGMFDSDSEDDVFGLNNKVSTAHSKQPGDLPGVPDLSTLSAVSEPISVRV